ncbi:MAG: two-component system response regulator HydG [Cellvibrionaceae bacterium]|jgi:two-component system response regulator HydG
MGKLLIVENDVTVRSTLRELLEQHQHHVREASCVREATSNHHLTSFDLIVSNLRLPGEPGTDLIQPAGNTPVLIMSSCTSLQAALEPMRMGAADYIVKPLDHHEMVNAIDRILRKQSKKTSLPPLEPQKFTAGMLGNSPVMQPLYKRIQQVAPTEATVLISGETGTGKELAALAIHKASQRRQKPLISINCAAIPENLIESELFGYKKGAFTGADSSREGLVITADGGTLFLDEIGELPMEAQARLLRVLQEGEVRRLGANETRKVNIRLIAATNRNLARRCREGAFREDLYFRLNVIKLQLPPLRSRGEDIVTIAYALVQRYCDSYNKPDLRLSPRAIQIITSYYWPGNVRELENAIQRAVILCEDVCEISHELLDLETELMSTASKNGTDPHQGQQSAAELIDNTQTNTLTNSPGAQKSLSLKDYFQHFVLKNQDNMSETQLAEKLGISRKCLWERRQKLGIPRKKPNSQDA